MVTGDVCRRQFLLSTGLVGSLALAGYRRRPVERTIDVRVWATEAAARHDDLWPRVRGYLGRALRDAHDSVAIEFGGRVTVDAEHGYRVVRSGEWPGRVAAGNVGLGELDTVDDVNLLVTDGDFASTPSAAGALDFAAVSGARQIARMPPVEECPPVVDVDRPALATQVLLHDVGHALGLRHGDGHVTDDDPPVVSPMVSAYAWADAATRERRLDGERGSCDGAARTVDADRARISLRYSACAAGQIRSYRGGPLP